MFFLVPSFLVCPTDFHRPRAPDSHAEACPPGEIIVLLSAFCFLLSVFSYYPTLPSRLMPSSLSASTANSMGSSCRTSLQNPLMIIEIASCSDNPRCVQ